MAEMKEVRTTYRCGHFGKPQLVPVAYPGRKIKHHTSCPDCREVRQIEREKWPGLEPA